MFQLPEVQGDVDLYLYKINNPNSSNVSYTIVASSAQSGNNESINYTGDGGFYVLRLYPYNGITTSGFTVTSTSSRTDDKDASKLKFE